MTYLLTFDPGMSTGITLGQYGEAYPYERLAFWQVEGGLSGLREWWSVHWELGEDGEGPYWNFPEARWLFDRPLLIYVNETTHVCEKFVPLPVPRTFKTAELEPIRIEGMIEDRLDGNVIWQRSSAMVLSQRGVLSAMTDRQKTAARKRASDDVLRSMGLWTTGKQVGMKDANDVNSAQKHAVAYLRSIKHRPTVDALGGQ
jgi:hypothetical protein